MYWYLSLGLLSLFWVWFLEGKPSGDKSWHLLANVFCLVFLWPIYVAYAVLDGRVINRSK